jgi:hypothetical protein
VVVNAMLIGVRIIVDEDDVLLGSVTLVALNETLVTDPITAGAV